MLNRSVVLIVSLSVIGLFAVSEAHFLGHRRGLTQSNAGPGIVVPVTPATPGPFSLSVFSIGPSNVVGQCVIQGYPGSRADSVVAGPLTFMIDPSIPSLTINFRSSNAAVVVYNNTMNVAVSNSTAAGLTSATYKGSSPGTSGSIYGGLINMYNPNDPAHNAASTPVCYMEVKYYAVAKGPAPAPASTGRYYG